MGSLHIHYKYICICIAYVKNPFDYQDTNIHRRYKYVSIIKWIFYINDITIYMVKQQ